MKNTFVKDIKSGTDLQNEIFAVKSSKKSLTKDGKPFIDLELIDKTGSIKAKIWSETINVCDEVIPGQIVRVYGKASVYNNKPQVTISAMNTTDEYDASDLIATTSHNLNEMKEQFQKILNEISDKKIKSLLDNIFDPETFKKFCTSPAAYTVHHAYRGGLLEHTLDLVEMAKVAIKRYPNLNPDILITGCILHDIGKLQEYSMDTTIQMTTKGKLQGHIYLGSELVKTKAPADFPEDLLVEIIHMILSHQGSLEFGSPILPKTPEAIALSAIDDASFKINTVYHAIDRYEGGEEFTDFQRHLGTDLYISPYHGTIEK